MMNGILVYCILNKSENRSYVGWTNNFQRRLRRHRGEIKGGARATRSYGPDAHPLFCVTGFVTKQHAMQLEWLLHRRESRRRRGQTTVAWRNRRLKEAFQLERFTKKAPVTATTGLTIVQDFS